MRVLVLMSVLFGLVAGVSSAFAAPKKPSMPTQYVEEEEDWADENLGGPDGEGWQMLSGPQAARAPAAAPTAAKVQRSEPVVPKVVPPLPPVPPAEAVRNGADKPVSSGMAMLRETVSEPAPTAVGPLPVSVAPGASVTPVAPAVPVTQAAQASPSAPAAVAVPVALTEFVLAGGESLQRQVQRWGKQAGWTVIWNVPDDWVVPGGGNFGTDFESAVQRVIEQSAANGADIVGDAWRGNRTVVIGQNGASE